MVYRFSAKEITDLYDLREALEVFATQTVEITDELIEALRHSLKRTQQLLDQDDKAAYIEEDIVFHQMIVNSTGNEQLSRVHGNIQDKLWLCRCQTYQLTSPDTPSAHRSITDALASHDRNAAREATQAHIRFVRNALLASAEPYGISLTTEPVHQPHAGRFRFRATSIQPCTRVSGHIHDAKFVANRNSGGGGENRTPVRSYDNRELHAFPRFIFVSSVRLRNGRRCSTDQSD